MKKNAGKREKGGKIDAPRSGKAAKSINQKFFLINIDPNIFRHLFSPLPLCLGKGKKHFQICRDTSFASPTNYLLVIRIFFFFQDCVSATFLFFPFAIPSGAQKRNIHRFPLNFVWKIHISLFYLAIQHLVVAFALGEEEVGGGSKCIHNWIARGGGGRGREREMYQND